MLGDSTLMRRSVLGAGTTEPLRTTFSVGFRVLLERRLGGVAPLHDRLAILRGIVDDDNRCGECFRFAQIEKSEGTEFDSSGVRERGISSPIVQNVHTEEPKVKSCYCTLW